MDSQSWHVKLQSHFQKRPIVFKAKWDYSGKRRRFSSSFVVLAEINLFFVHRPVVCTSGQVISFIFGRFLQLKQSLNSSSSNPWSLSDCRHSLCLSSVTRDLGIWIVLKWRPADTNWWPKIDRGSTGHWGRCWQIGLWMTNRKRIALNIYNHSVDKLRPYGRRHATNVFVNKLKECLASSDTSVGRSCFFSWRYEESLFARHQLKCDLGINNKCSMRRFAKDLRIIENKKKHL